ncbi:hypothetical protein [Pseudomonas phage vB_Pae_BR201a]|nr:hypothetical protein [Pseudomonas phage vB_Pae_BR201a]QBI78988.1 hypothetical protein [Pseudomonas phage vB_Pae_BR201a]
MPVLPICRYPPHNRLSRSGCTLGFQPLPRQAKPFSATPGQTRPSHVMPSHRTALHLKRSPLRQISPLCCRSFSSASANAAAAFRSATVSSSSVLPRPWMCRAKARCAGPL